MLGPSQHLDADPQTPDHALLFGLHGVLQPPNLKTQHAQSTAVNHDIFPPAKIHTHTAPVFDFANVFAPVLASPEYKLADVEHALGLINVHFTDTQNDRFMAALLKTEIKPALAHFKLNQSLQVLVRICGHVLIFSTSTAHRDIAWILLCKTAKFDVGLKAIAADAYLSASIFNNFERLTELLLNGNCIDTIYLILENKRLDLYLQWIIKSAIEDNENQQKSITILFLICSNSETTTNTKLKCTEFPDFSTRMAALISNPDVVIGGCAVAILYNVLEDGDARLELFSEENMKQLSIFLLRIAGKCFGNFMFRKCLFRLFKPFALARRLHGNLGDASVVIIESLVSTGFSESLDTAIEIYCGMSDSGLSSSHPLFNSAHTSRLHKHAGSRLLTLLEHPSGMFTTQIKHLLGLLKFGFECNEIIPNGSILQDCIAKTLTFVLDTDELEDAVMVMNMAVKYQQNFTWDDQTLIRRRIEKSRMDLSQTIQSQVALISLLTLRHKFSPLDQLGMADSELSRICKRVLCESMHYYQIECVLMFLNLTSFPLSRFASLDINFADLNGGGMDAVLDITGRFHLILRAQEQFRIKGLETARAEFQREADNGVRAELDELVEMRRTNTVISISENEENGRLKLRNAQLEDELDCANANVVQAQTSLSLCEADFEVLKTKVGVLEFDCAAKDNEICELKEKVLELSAQVTQQEEYEDMVALLAQKLHVRKSK